MGDITGSLGIVKTMPQVTEEMIPRIVAKFNDHGYIPALAQMLGQDSMEGNPYVIRFLYHLAGEVVLPNFNAESSPHCLVGSGLYVYGMLKMAGPVPNILEDAVDQVVEEIGPRFNRERMLKEMVKLYGLPERNISGSNSNVGKLITMLTKNAHDPMATALGGLGTYRLLERQVELNQSL